MTTSDLSPGPVEGPQREFPSEDRVPSTGPVASGPEAPGGLASQAAARGIRCALMGLEGVPGGSFE